MDMVLRGIVLCAALVMLAATCRAQDDLDGPWLAPTLDALERFREDPVCLRCATSTSLTQIPGISRRTASRIVAACRSASLVSIEQLADSVCASPEQFLMLNACATLTCTCFTLIRSLRARVRMREGNNPQYVTRVDATHAYGVAGASLQRTPDATNASAWLTATFDDVDISMGDIALLSGTGLLLGTGRTLARRGVDVLPASTPVIATRPWPSTAFDNAPRGITALWRSAALPLSIGAATWIDRASSESDIHSSLHLQTHIASIDVFGSVVRRSQSARPFEAASIALSHYRDNLQVSAELRGSSAMVDAAHLIAGYNADRTDVVVAAWTYSPDSESALGSSALGTTQPRNDRGLHIAAHHRFSWQLSLAASITMSERISRTYLDPLPPSTTDLRWDAEFRPTRATLLRLRLAHRRSLVSESTPDGRAMSSRIFPQLRIDCESQITRRIMLRGRLDLRGARTDADQFDVGSMLSVVCRVQLTRTLTLSAQVVQWNAPSYDVASRVSTLSVPGTFDILVCTNVGSALHMQARWELPYNFALAAHMRHEQRVSQTTTQWTLQSEWRLPRANQRTERVGFMHEMLSD